jgi:hypothetical protein
MEKSFAFLGLARFTFFGGSQKLALPRFGGQHWGDA